MLVVIAGIRETAGAASASSAATAARANVPRVGVHLALALVSSVIESVLPQDPEVMSWRTQRIRLAAASGWSPNSWAIWPAQPPMPNYWTARLMAVATVSAVGASEGCSP